MLVMPANLATMQDRRAAAGGQAVDFTTQVQPLLRRSCLDCHGPARARGGLRVDRADSLRAVIAPGERDGSPLYARLLGAGGEPRMPEGRPALAAADIALVGRWIDAGAPGLAGSGDDDGRGPRPGHWAYRPPVRPPVPGDGEQHPIDAFLQVDRARAGLRPAPEAARETLIRRVTLDLTGLPPTLAEIDAFVADRGPDAYERLVDRLLGTPAFGERWAVPWLDAARYADSNGYEKDGARPVWKYRDWVVSALNADLPFDRFTLEQIAGDLLPGATLPQRIATGFHRNAMFNEEAGVDPEEARWERLVDRVSTTATIWLGSTLACAQCHDHKHDPFSQRDFYRLLAFFEGAEEQTLALPTPAQAARLAALDPEIGRLQKLLDTWTPALGQAQTRWEQRLREHDRAYAPLERLIATGESAQVRANGDGTIQVVGPPEGAHDREVAGASRLGRITGVRLLALPDPGLPGGGPGLGRDGAFFLAGLDLEAAPASGAPTWRPVPLARALADDRPREEPERYAPENLLPDRPRPPSLDADTPRGWGVSPIYDGSTRRPRQLVLVPRAPFGFPGGTRLRVRLRYGADSQGEVIGRYQISVTASSEPAAVVSVDGGLRAALDRPAERRSRLERDQLAQAYRKIAPELDGARARLAALQTERAALGVASTLVLAPSNASGPPATPFRRGGSFLRPGEPVTAALPGWLRPAGGGPGDRLALGRWLASADNPLAARALVNRLWAAYFGRGLVETVEDLGHQGARPSHPLLLDWLATELRPAGLAAEAPAPADRHVGQLPAGGGQPGRPPARSRQPAAGARAAAAPGGRDGARRGAGGGRDPRAPGGRAAGVPAAAARGVHPAQQHRGPLAHQRGIGSPPPGAVHVLAPERAPPGGRAVRRPQPADLHRAPAAIAHAAAGAGDAERSGAVGSGPGAGPPHARRTARGGQRRRSPDPRVPAGHRAAAAPGGAAPACWRCCGGSSTVRPRAPRAPRAPARTTWPWRWWPTCCSTSMRPSAVADRPDRRRALPARRPVAAGPGRGAAGGAGGLFAAGVLALALGGACRRGCWRRRCWRARWPGRRCPVVARGRTARRGAACAGAGAGRPGRPPRWRAPLASTTCPGTGRCTTSQAVLALAGGWNPLWDGPLSLDDRPDNLWINHYPKAAWVMQAILLQATGALEATKGVQLLALLAAALAVFAALRARCTGGRRWWRCWPRPTRWPWCRRSASTSTACRRR